MDIRVYLKKYFRDKAILLPDQAEGAQADAIILHQLDGKEAALIANDKVLIAKDIHSPFKYDTLSISTTFPPRIRVNKASEEVPESYIPVADWDGKNLRIAISEKTMNSSVRSTLLTGLPVLLRIKAENSTGVDTLRQKISLGLSKERKALEENAFKNRKYAEKQFEEIRKFLESAARQERIAAGLEQLERGQLDEFAQSQWGDMQRLVPGAIQDLYISGDYIIAITNPIQLSGVFIGACRIEMDIPTAKVMVFAEDTSAMRGGYCHPHVQHDGNPCWGNLERSITDMSAKRDFYGLLCATLRLLHQYVYEDAYIKVNEWGAVASKPEEGSNCQKYGPNHSYAQMKICMNCTTECFFTRQEKISACVALRNVGDCLTCKIGADICMLYDKRFSSCYDYQLRAGVTYCLIKCTNTECPYLDKAQVGCQMQNQPTEAPCPAKSVCRKPCA